MAIIQLAILFLIACLNPDGPSKGAYRWVVPDSLRPGLEAIWAKAEECTGHKGSFARVVWYLVPGKTFTVKGVPDAMGHWYPPHNIEIAEGWQNIAWVWKHEMIHDLLQQGHNEKQRLAIWGVKCHATWGYLDSPDSTYRP